MALSLNQTGAYSGKLGENVFSRIMNHLLSPKLKNIYDNWEKPQRLAYIEKAFSLIMNAIYIEWWYLNREQVYISSKQLDTAYENLNMMDNKAVSRVSASIGWGTDEAKVVVASLIANYGGTFSDTWRLLPGMQDLLLPEYDVSVSSSDLYFAIKPELKETFRKAQNEYYAELRFARELPPDLSPALTGSRVLAFCFALLKDVNLATDSKVFEHRLTQPQEESIGKIKIKAETPVTEEFKDFLKKTYSASERIKLPIKAVVLFPRQSHTIGGRTEDKIEENDAFVFIDPTGGYKNQPVKYLDIGYPYTKIDIPYRFDDGVAKLEGGFLSWNYLKNGKRIAELAQAVKFTEPELTAQQKLLQKYDIKITSHWTKPNYPKKQKQYFLIEGPKDGRSQRYSQQIKITGRTLSFGHWDRQRYRWQFWTDSPTQIAQTMLDAMEGKLLLDEEGKVVRPEDKKKISSPDTTRQHVEDKPWQLSHDEFIKYATETNPSYGERWEKRYGSYDIIIWSGYIKDAYDTGEDIPDSVAKEAHLDKWREKGKSSIPSEPILSIVPKIQPEPEPMKFILPPLDRRRVFTGMFESPNVRVQIMENIRGNSLFRVSEIPQTPIGNHKQWREWELSSRRTDAMYPDNNFLAANIAMWAKLQTDDTYDTIIAKIRRGVLEAMKRSNLGEDLDNRKDISMKETLIYYAEIPPIGYQPIEIKTDDFHLISEWTKFESQHWGGGLTFHEDSKSAGGARKLYKFLSENPSLRALGPGSFAEILKDLKIATTHFSQLSYG